MKPGDLILFKPEYCGEEFADKLGILLKKDEFGSWVVYCEGHEYYVNENEVEVATERN